MKDKDADKNKIRLAYRAVGRLSSLYDGMMTNSTHAGRFAMRWLWGLADADYRVFLRRAYDGIPRDFCGRLLEIPVGTGVLSMPVYRNLPKAEIYCLDFSEAMLDAAKDHAERMRCDNVRFMIGDVGQLPFAANTFDIVLSVNGLHAFPDKNAAYAETCRVLKDGGIFCGSVYVKGEKNRTDFFVKHFCQRHGYFTPPYETFASLNAKLKTLYKDVNVSHVGSFASFVCRK